MAFRKRKEPEAPVAQVDWRDVNEFLIGTMERPQTAARKQAVRGLSAIRVPQGDGEERVFAPCAYRAPASAPLPPGLTGQRLFEDEEGHRLLCHVDDGTEDGQIRRHEVRDGHGTVIGTIVRHPPKRRRAKHSWHIEQPGRPEIFGGRSGLGSSVNPFELGLDMLVSGAVEMLTPGGFEDDGNNRPSSRRLQWKADGEVVMSSQGTECTIRADWLDRRLAFAFILLGDR